MEDRSKRSRSRFLRLRLSRARRFGGHAPSPSSVEAKNLISLALGSKTRVIARDQYGSVSRFDSKRGRGIITVARGVIPGAEWRQRVLVLSAHIIGAHHLKEGDPVTLDIVAKSIGFCARNVRRGIELPAPFLLAGGSE